MHVLLTGSTGLIGTAIAARLLAEGYEVTGVGRRGGPQPGMRWITLDVRAADRPENWLPLLKGIDAVINCVGVLQDSTVDSTQAAHASGPEALFAACEKAGVKRVIHFSAIGSIGRRRAIFRAARQSATRRSWRATWSGSS